MSELKIFDFNEVNVRTIFKNDVAHFVAKDVCKVLGIKNHNDALSRLNEKMKGIVTTDTLGGKQELSTVTEAGVYKLAFTSRKPEAERFTDWLANDVLPQIRKHGMYAKDELLDNPDLLLDVISKYKAERDINIKLQLENEKKQKQIVEMKPKVDFADTLLKSEDSVLVRQFAKTLKDEGFDMGQRKLFEWLKDNKYLMKNNEPYQAYMKYFTVVERVVERGNYKRITFTTKINPRGQYYFFKKIRECFKN